MPATPGGLFLFSTEMPVPENVLLLTALFSVPWRTRERNRNCTHELACEQYKRKEDGMSYA